MNNSVKTKMLKGFVSIMSAGCVMASPYILRYVGHISINQSIQNTQELKTKINVLNEAQISANKNLDKQREEYVKDVKTAFRHHKKDVEQMNQAIEDITLANDDSDRILKETTKALEEANKITPIEPNDVIHCYEVCNYDWENETELVDVEIPEGYWGGKPETNPLKQPTDTPTPTPEPTVEPTPSPIIVEGNRVFEISNQVSSTKIHNNVMTVTNKDNELTLKFDIQVYCKENNGCGGCHNITVEVKPSETKIIDKLTDHEGFSCTPWSLGVVNVNVK